MLISICTPSKLCEAAKDNPPASVGEIILNCDWMWVKMGKAADEGAVWPHTPCLGQVWSNRPLICVLKCFGSAVRSAKL
jgi:hypothetical protein